MWYWSDLDTEKVYGWDLDSPEGPPPPPTVKYRIPWSNTTTKTRKSRIDDYAKYMVDMKFEDRIEFEKGLGQKVTDLTERTPEFVSVEGRVSIGAAVFTIDCELFLWLEEEPHILQIKYKREDHTNAPEISHEIFDKDIVEMKLFHYNDPHQVPKRKTKTYLGLRANITDMNDLRQYYGGLHRSLNMGGVLIRISATKTTSHSK